MADMREALTRCMCRLMPPPHSPPPPPPILPPLIPHPPHHLPHPRCSSLCVLIVGVVAPPPSCVYALSVSSDVLFF